jgi:hypothetical protein
MLNAATTGSVTGSIVDLTAGAGIATTASATKNLK